MTTIIRWPVRRAAPQAEDESFSADARVDALCRQLEAEDASSGFGGLGPPQATAQRAGAGRVGPLRRGGAQGTPAQRRNAALTAADAATLREERAYVQGARDGRVAGLCWGLMIGGALVAAAILGGGVR